MKFLVFLVLVLSIAVGYIYQDHLPIQDFITSIQEKYSSSITSSTSMEPKKIIVVGGGLAGLSATVEATRAGNSVVIIDKADRLGGNSGKASSGINAIFTNAQQSAQINDSFEQFYQDTLKSGGGRSKESLINILVRQSTSAVEFLESFGVNLGLTSQCGGHSVSRTHRASPRPDGRVSNVGWDIVKVLINRVQNHPNVTVMTSTQVTDLITNHLAKVSGVHYEKKNNDKVETGSIEADAVILTTGGYGADRSPSSFIAQFAPKFTHLSTTNGPWASGDGIRIAQQIGAGIVDMDQVQIHPTGFVDRKNPKTGTKFLAPEALRASGGILVNHEGKRFVNELGKRNDVSQAIFDNCKPFGEDGPIVSYLLLTMEGGKKFNEKILGFYKSKGFVEYFDYLTDLCRAFDLPEENVKETIRRYSSAKSKGVDSFGKSVFPTDFTTEEPLYGMLITPCIHYTMGGLQFDEDAQVLRDDGSPIPGLYAAGEVTGGLHGENRLAGNSLLECVVFGRIAGKNAGF